MKKAVIITSGILLVFISTALKGASGGPGILATICSIAGGILFLYGIFVTSSKKQ
jgi:hypothetical protein